MSTSLAKNWSFTLNNFNEEEIVLLRNSASLPCTRYLVFQQEVGEEGTPHIQGYISLNNRQRLNQLKKLVGNRAHLEVARGTANQNRGYCTKTESAVPGTVEEFGAIPTEERGKRSDISALAETIKSGVFDLKRLRDEHPEACGKYPRLVRELIEDHRPSPPVPEHEFRTWQSDLMATLEEDPNDRDVVFIVDKTGNQGKTWFAKRYCLDHSDAQYMEPAKKADMAYALRTDIRVLFINVTRTKDTKSQEYLYSFIESVKDGMVFSPKYESGMKCLAPPHVVVMTNSDPDYDMLSPDRFVVVDLY